MPVTQEDSLKEHCTFIAKYLSLVIPLLKSEQQNDNACQEMRPIVQELDKIFQDFTGFPSMGRDSAQLIGYFPNRDIVFKSEVPCNWQDFAERLAHVIELNQETLTKLASLQGSSKSIFSPTPNDISSAASTFSKRCELIKAELAPEGACVL